MMMRTVALFLALLGLAGCEALSGAGESTDGVAQGVARSSDGVAIAYDARGAGEPALG